jgi:hypothetical protein
MHRTDAQLRRRPEGMALAVDGEAGFHVRGPVLAMLVMLARLRKVYLLFHADCFGDAAHCK